MSPLRAAACLVGLLAVAGCKPRPSPEPPEPDTSVSSPPGSADDGGAGASDTEPPDCTADGEPWDGKAEGCLYEHGGCCYPTPDAMCAAAGCAPDACMILESSPAQARCAAAPPTS